MEITVYKRKGTKLEGLMEIESITIAASPKTIETRNDLLVLRA